MAAAAPATEEVTAGGEIESSVGGVVSGMAAVENVVRPVAAAPAESWTASVAVMTDPAGSTLLVSCTFAP